MRSPSTPGVRPRPWVHVLAQLVGLAMIVVAVAVLWGWEWALGVAGIGALSIGVLLEARGLAREEPAG